MFKCVCGKEFKSKQALGGHQGYCKEYLGEDRYLEIINKNKEGQLKAKQTLLNNNKIKKQQELQQWISEKHECEKCGKIMTEKYASGRFCCKECAKGFSNYQSKDIEKEDLINTYSYICSVCNKRYKNKNALSQHLCKTHHDYYETHRFLVMGTGLIDITKQELEEYRKIHTKCEICGKDVEDIRKENNHFNDLCIDHNHTTNQFRGLLCMTCNRALGWFEKNEQNILEYLNNKGRE